jgi:sugar phosphate isomerase/epimerase
MRKTSRRDFLKRTGRGAAAAALVPGVATSLLSCRTKDKAQKGEGLRLGMASYTFREFGLEETLSMTQRLGLPCIAFKSFHLPMESTPEQIREVAARVKASGLDLYGGGVIYMKDRSEVERAFDYARAAGMRVIIGVPDHEMIPLVEEKIKHYDIKVAIHNHGPGDDLYPTPQSAYDRIRGLDPRFGLCVDVGHTQRAGVDPAASIRKLADRVLDVHIKDVTAATGEGRTVEIGRGVIDIPAVCRTLLEIGFSGAVSFEFEKDGKDPLPGVAESVGYVRGVLAAL